MPSSKKFFHWLGFWPQFVKRGFLSKLSDKRIRKFTFRLLPWKYVKSEKKRSRDITPPRLPFSQFHKQKKSANLSKLWTDAEICETLCRREQKARKSHRKRVVLSFPLRRINLIQPMKNQQKILESKFCLIMNFHSLLLRFFWWVYGFIICSTSGIIKSCCCCFLPESAETANHLKELWEMVNLCPARKLRFEDLIQSERTKKILNFHFRTALSPSWEQFHFIFNPRVANFPPSKFKGASTAVKENERPQIKVVVEVVLRWLFVPELGLEVSVPLFESKSFLSQRRVKIKKFLSITSNNPLCACLSIAWVLRKMVHFRQGGTNVLALINRRQKWARESRVSVENPFRELSWKNSAHQS